jgi:hypothetical protein
MPPTTVGRVPFECRSPSGSFFHGETHESPIRGHGSCRSQVGVFPSKWARANGFAPLAAGPRSSSGDRARRPSLSPPGRGVPVGRGPEMLRRPRRDDGESPPASPAQGNFDPPALRTVSRRHRRSRASRVSLSVESLSMVRSPCAPVGPRRALERRLALTAAWSRRPGEAVPGASRES